MRTANITVSHCRGEFDVDCSESTFDADSFLEERLIDGNEDEWFIETSDDGTQWVSGDEISDAFIELEDNVGYKLTVDSGDYTITKEEWPAVDKGINVTYLTDDVVEIFIKL